MSKLSLIFLVLFPSVIFSNSLQKITIMVIREGLHVPEKTEIKYFFSIKDEKNINGKIIQNGVSRNIVKGKYLPIINRILSSPLIKADWKEQKVKRCIQATHLKIEIDGKVKEIILCENPYQLTKQQKALHNWANYFLRN